MTLRVAEGRRCMSGGDYQGGERQVVVSVVMVVMSACSEGSIYVGSWMAFDWHPRTNEKHLLKEMLLLTWFSGECDDK